MGELVRDENKNLQNELIPVLETGVCVGCGVCAAYSPDSVRMSRDNSGAMVAELYGPSHAKKASGGVCPFGDYAPDEDAHSKNLYPDLPENSDFGRFASLWAGHVEEGEYRSVGSSGGITSWIVAELLSKGVVDAVVHVHLAKKENGSDLFGYSVSRDLAGVCDGAKTRYYSVSMDKALHEIMGTGERIALVGVPCFIKAARNLALKNRRFGDGLVVALSLVCGHMKSAGFAESLSWQAGVKPQGIGEIDFRAKIPGLSANNYGFSVNTEGREIVKPMASIAGRRWDGGYHRLKACDYCDDVFGETADVSIGDAWLPEYVRDYKGTNIVVVRSLLLDKLIRSAIEEGRLSLDPIDEAKVSSAQSGGLRDRREGLSYRLFVDRRKGNWLPKCRVDASKEGLSFVRRMNYRLRRIVRRRSATSFNVAKKLGLLQPYVWEMTFWHACFRLLSIIESRFFKKN